MSVYLLYSVVLIFLFTNGKFSKVYAASAYKWEAFDGTFPENAFVMKSSPLRYAGRARHFDEILPAEIYSNGSAFIFSCQKIIPKESLEILTTSTKCDWIKYSKPEEIDDTVVRVGTAWNNEPIYLGRSHRDYNLHVSSIYLTNGITVSWVPTYYDYDFLSCAKRDKWVDSSALDLPNNTVSGGKSEEETNIFVARLKKICNVVTGQVDPEQGKATAILSDGSVIESVYCQVLVQANKNEYKWISATSGVIPDYAVVNGKRGNELSYVAKVNQTIGHLTFSEALSYKRTKYEILVNNKF